MLSRAAAEPRRFPRRPAGGVNPVPDDEGCRIYALVSPEFHSELSAIERCWAVLKYYVRRYHDYAESLRACILLAVKDF